MELLNWIVLFSNLLSFVPVKCELTLPIAVIFRVNASGKAVSVANKIPNSETVVRLNERLRLRCTAPYPIQWIYAGNGAPDFVKTTSTDKQTNLYQTFLKIESTQEKHTGRYKCRSIESRNISTYQYLFVPGPELFTATQGKDILISLNDQLITIPCTVSQKDARVFLQKSIEDVLQGPIPTAEPYNPKIGFRLRISELHDQDPTGIYVCSASYMNIFRLIEYNLISRDSVDRINFKSCTPSPCGKNARCRLLGTVVTCTCFESFSGDPYHACEKHCIQNSGCPDYLFCNSTSRTCENPCGKYDCDYNVSECKVNSHFPACAPSTRVKQETCGKKSSCPSGTQCKSQNGQPKCVCAKNFLGNNPENGCYAPCQNSADCSSTKACDYPVCVDPCKKFNPCGVNANCIVQRHSRMCKCNEGYTGQPADICHLITTTAAPQSVFSNSNETSSGNQNADLCNSCGPRSSCNLVNGKVVCACKPGYLGQAPNCRPSCALNKNCPSKLSCILGRCVDPCGETRLCGINAECSVENHYHSCTCAVGFEGNPYEGCTTEIDTSLGPGFSPRCPENICPLKNPRSTGNRVKIPT